MSLLKYFPRKENLELCLKTIQIVTKSGSFNINTEETIKELIKLDPSIIEKGLKFMDDEFRFASLDPIYNSFPDNGTHLGRIDLFFMDKKHIPLFIEIKKRAGARAYGQMLKYRMFVTSDMRLMLVSIFESDHWSMFYEKYILDFEKYGIEYCNIKNIIFKRINIALNYLLKIFFFLCP